MPLDEAIEHAAKPNISPVSHGLVALFLGLPPILLGISSGLEPYGFYMSHPAPNLDVALRCGAFLCFFALMYLLVRDDGRYLDWTSQLSASSKPTFALRAIVYVFAMGIAGSFLGEELVNQLPRDMPYSNERMRSDAAPLRATMKSIGIGAFICHPHNMTWEIRPEDGMGRTYIHRNVASFACPVKEYDFSASLNGETEIEAHHLPENAKHRYTYEYRAAWEAVPEAERLKSLEFIAKQLSAERPQIEAAIAEQRAEYKAAMEEIDRRYRERIGRTHSTQPSAAGAIK